MVVEDRETLRIEARRQREQERCKKLGPGRLRNIGADIAGVKNQVEEKKRQEEVEKDAQRRDEEENEAIRRYLIQIESEDAFAKRQELLTLRNDWQLQQAEREQAREREQRERAATIDPDGCAASAAQKFNGEDPLRLERTRLQAMQLKQWTLQQMEERRQRNDLDAAAQRQFAAYIVEIERMQEELHHANERERAQVALEMQRFNQHMLDEKRERDRRRRQQEQETNAQEIQYNLTSNLISENPLQAQLPGVPLDQRVRVDHWKGLSTEQTRQYLSQNEQLLAEKTRQQELARQQAEEEARQQAQLNRILAEDEHQTQQRKAQAQLELRQTLERQAREAAEREQKNAQQARGKVEPAFFQAFGRSYR